MLPGGVGVGGGVRSVCVPPSITPDGAEDAMAMDDACCVKGRSIIVAGKTAGDAWTS